MHRMGSGGTVSIATNVDGIAITSSSSVVPPPSQTATPIDDSLPTQFSIIETNGKMTSSGCQQWHIHKSEEGSKNALFFTQKDAKKCKGYPPAQENHKILTHWVGAGGTVSITTNVDGGIIMPIPVAVIVDTMDVLSCVCVAVASTRIVCYLHLLICAMIEHVAHWRNEALWMNEQWYGLFIVIEYLVRIYSPCGSCIYNPIWSMDRIVVGKS